MSLCPCGLGEPYDACCGRFHQGIDQGVVAPSAELLMRARYSAYVLGERDFLLRTWHDKTRPRLLTVEDGQHWKGLYILDRTGGGLFDTEGTVEFKARYEADGKPGVMHDRSRFVKTDGVWFYLDETPDEG